MSQKKTADQPANQPSNQDIAALLDRIADLLEVQEANTFRIRAYRSGAQSVRAADQPVARLARQDEAALETLPEIGQGLARIIIEYVQTGRSSVLDRLEGEIEPEALFTKVPGVGQELARRIVEELDIHTLEELERAAHDGRLGTVAGFGSRRVKAVRVALAGMLSESSQRRSHRVATGEHDAETEEPSVALLLDVDAEYRRLAKAGELKKIAPRRFNPDNEAWLPIMHTEREGWDFTVLYSNTARAHELGTTHDWVVIYYDRDGREQQSTVVTETSGPLKGKRVVRGREGETRRHYEA